MNATGMASLNARKERRTIAANVRRSDRVVSGGYLHRLEGSHLCISREAGVGLVVWQDQGNHLLRRFPLGHESGARAYRLTGTRLLVVQGPNGGRTVWVDLGACLRKRMELEEARP